jgi:NADPH:quinone reductase-like Zn-dependent oxidoreductase
VPALPWGSRSGQKLRSLISLTTVDDLERVAALLSDGSMHAAIERRYPLAEVPDAMRRLAAGQAHGKLVIAVSDA